MQLCHSVSVLIFVICSHEGIHGNLLRTSQTVDSKAETRNKRNLVVRVTIKAVDEIFEQAKRLYSNGLDTVFLKNGGLKQAQQDFDSIMSANPKSVRERKVKGTKDVKKTGRIGARMRIELLQSEPNPKMTLTTCSIECSRYRQPRIMETIIYTD